MTVETIEALADPPPARVRLWPLGSNRFHVDGFVFREKDFLVEFVPGENGQANQLQIEGTKHHQLTSDRR
jgi:hypothetical protein